MTDELDLIDEIRAVRQRLWEEHGGSARDFASWLMGREALHPERLHKKTVRSLSEEEIDEIEHMLGR